MEPPRARGIARSRVRAAPLAPATRPDSDNRLLNRREPSPFRGTNIPVAFGVPAAPLNSPQAPLEPRYEAPERQFEIVTGDQDIRPPDARDHFRAPEPRPDPSYFQIEPVPLRDRRARQLFRHEPYSHLGARFGSFVLLSEFELSGTWNSNVFFSSPTQSDSALELASLTRLVSDWRRHAVELRFSSANTFYKRLGDENATQYTGEVRAQLDVTHRTNISTLISRTIAPESRSSADTASGVTDRSTITTDEVALTLNHRFNRLSLQARGRVIEESNSESVIGGLTQSNRERDNRRQTGALRLSWELRPTFSFFGEVEKDIRDFEIANGADGLRRDSQGERYRAGLSFGATGAYVRGELSVGYGVQRPDEDAFVAFDGVLFDANVAWLMTRLTTVQLEARTAFEDTTLANSPGAISRQVGISLRHALRRNVSLETGVSYELTDYAGIEFSERDLTVRAGIDYSINRHVMLFGRVEHLRQRATDSNRNTQSHEIRFGVRLRN